MKSKRNITVGALKTRYSIFIPYFFQFLTRHLLMAFIFPCLFIPWPFLSWLFFFPFSITFSIHFFPSHCSIYSFLSPFIPFSLSPFIPFPFSLFSSLIPFFYRAPGNSWQLEPSHNPSLSSPTPWVWMPPRMPQTWCPSCVPTIIRHRSRQNTHSSRIMAWISLKVRERKSILAFVQFNFGWKRKWHCKFQILIHLLSKRQ